MLHIIYTYLIVALFSDDWLLPFDDNITIFHSRSSLDCLVRHYFFNLLFHLRYARAAV